MLMSDLEVQRSTRSELGVLEVNIIFISPDAL